MKRALEGHNGATCEVGWGTGFLLPPLEGLTQVVELRSRYGQKNRGRWASSDREKRRAWRSNEDNFSCGLSCNEKGIQIFSKHPPLALRCPVEPFRYWKYLMRPPHRSQNRMSGEQRKTVISSFGSILGVCMQVQPGRNVINVMTYARKFNKGKWMQDPRQFFQLLSLLLHIQWSEQFCPHRSLSVAFRRLF